MIKVLIVDDHPVVMRGLLQVIQSEWPDAHCVMIDNARQIVNLVSTSEWDIIITDINLPDMNGIMALEQIRKIRPGLPVLIMSMYSAEEYAVPVMKAGAAGFINKAMVHELLPQAIREILSGKKFIPPDIKFLLEKKHKETSLPHLQLSDRELYVFLELAKGKSLTEISKILSIALSSVSTYRLRVLGKMSLKTNAEITRYCLKNNLLESYF